MASKIQNKLLKELRARKIFGMSINASGVSRVGMPDVIIFPGSGRAVFVEVKEKGDRLSDIQIDTIDMLKKLGHIVFVMTNTNQLIELLTLIETIRE